MLLERNQKSGTRLITPTRVRNALKQNYEMINIPYVLNSGLDKFGRVGFHSNFCSFL